MSKQNDIEHALSQLKHEKMPSRDLWQGIEYEISKPNAQADIDETHKKFSKKPMLGLAASIAMVSIVAYFSFQTGITTSGEDLAAALSEQHQLHREALISSFEGQPSVTENWQEQLAELDEAAVAIKKALQAEPNNAALLKMLKKVHEQQISLIEQVHKPAWQQI